MKEKFPILLSFYGLSNLGVTLVFGQLTYTGIRDLTFIDYSRRKTFRTLFRLYRTRPYSNQRVTLVFDKGTIDTTTNLFGAFYEKKPADMGDAVLQKVVLPDGREVRIIADLYETIVRRILSPVIVVSDIDDTLVHSFIYKKLRKLRTLMFTTMEKRRTVEDMQTLITNFTRAGAAPVYLSNSEQNLHPMIYRFLYHNNFPPGPLFLKQLRSLWDVLWNIKFPVKNTHKTNTLEELIKFFPEKKFVLMGDNTQHDLEIYLSIAEKYSGSVKYIIIRRVIEKSGDEHLIRLAADKIGTGVYYSDNFPTDFQL